MYTLINSEGKQIKVDAEIYEAILNVEEEVAILTINGETNVIEIEKQEF